MRMLLIFPLAFFVVSCGVYESRFDCPPGKGIGCASVSEVLDLIVERDRGEDLMVSEKGRAILLRQKEEEISHKEPLPIKIKLRLVKESGKEAVWVEEQE